MSNNYSEFEIKHVVYPGFKDNVIEVKVEVTKENIWDIDEVIKKAKKTRRQKGKE